MHKAIQPLFVSLELRADKAPAGSSARRANEEAHDGLATLIFATRDTWSGALENECKLWRRAATRAPPASGPEGRRRVTEECAACVAGCAGRRPTKMRETAKEIVESTSRWSHAQQPRVAQKAARRLGEDLAKCAQVHVRRCASRDVVDNGDDDEGAVAEGDIDAEVGGDQTLDASKLHARLCKRADQSLKDFAAWILQFIPATGAAGCSSSNEPSLESSEHADLCARVAEAKSVLENARAALKRDISPPASHPPPPQLQRVSPASAAGSALANSAQGDVASMARVPHLFHPLAAQASSTASAPAGGSVDGTAATRANGDRTANDDDEPQSKKRRH